jgi:ech hydrogenase subunit A
MYCIRVNKVRNAVAYISAVIIMIAVGVLVFFWGTEEGMQRVTLFKETEAVDHLILAAEVLLMCVVTFLSFKYKRPWISLLSIAPTVAIIWLELFSGVKMAQIDHIKIDHLSVLMCLIIGIIGSLIVIYAVGYMHGYQHYHTDIPDRRYYFFMIP